MSDHHYHSQSPQVPAKYLDSGQTDPKFGEGAKSFAELKKEMQQ